MANIAQMINVLQAMILIDKKKIVLTPTYHAFRMYTPFQDAQSPPIQFNAGSSGDGDVRLPGLDAIAARDSPGKLWIEFTNLDPENPLQVDVELTGVAAKSASGETLTAPKSLTVVLIQE